MTSRIARLRGLRAQVCRLGALLAAVAAITPVLAPLHAQTGEVVRPLPYDLLYVRAPYFGPGPAQANSLWPDTVRPLVPDPGAQLMVLRANGQREVLFPLERYRALVDTPPAKPLSAGSVSDLNVSFDGTWVLFSWYHDLTERNPQRDNLSLRGADLYKLNLVNRELVRLTRQQLTPNTGNGARFSPGAVNSNHPRIGVFNTGGTWVPGGRIAFTSSRNDLSPPRAFNWIQRDLQLFAMDDDGSNVTQIGHFNLGMALHPQILLDGRIAFTSWEMHGVRDLRQFALWAVRPDGTQWRSLSGYSEPALAHHFMTQMPGSDLVVTRYYNLNNNGFGDLVRFPLLPNGANGPDFGPIDAADGQIPFERIGQVLLTPWTTPDDYPAPCPGRESDPYGSAGAEACAGAERRGKLTHPAATPSAFGDPAKADLLAVYAPGPANHNGIFVGSGAALPWYHGEIVILPDGAPITIPAPDVSGRPPGLVTVLAEPSFNLQWPRPVVTYQRLYGVASPPALPEATDLAIRAERLTPGQPFGLIGSSSLLWRDTEGAFGPYLADRDPFNEPEQNPPRWIRQGSDAGVYTDDDVYAVRILMQQAQTDRTFPNGGPRFAVVGGERMRILGEIPVRKSGHPRLLHPDGTMREDTSFLAKVPADTSFTFQALDRRGMVLSMAQTWHQVRPGEARYDCGGCHAHSKDPLLFASTAAARPAYVIPDLAHSTPLLALEAGGATTVRTLPAHAVAIEYTRDVLPILERRCASCHGATNPAAGLPLTAAAGSVDRGGTFPRTYFQLVRDKEGEFSEPPLGAYGVWFLPQLTRYVRAFNARQSLLVWKAWGERLDGRSNATRNDDLDLTPSSAHPAGVGVAGMTYDEKMTLARWIDLGAPIELGRPWGYLEDDLRPTLVLRPSTSAARATGGFDTLEISAFDVESGVVPATLSVTSSLRLGRFAPGANLAAGKPLDAEGKVLRLTLPRRVLLSERPVFTVRVKDAAGHQTEIVRTYRP